MDGERGDPVIGCRPSGTFKGARMARAKREPEEPEESGEGCGQVTFEGSGKPERLRDGFCLGRRVGSKGCRVRCSCWPRMPGHL